MRVFAANLETLDNNPATQRRTRDGLLKLPDQLASRLFSALRQDCPALLIDDFVVDVCGLVSGLEARD